MTRADANDERPSAGSPDGKREPPNTLDRRTTRSLLDLVEFGRTAAELVDRGRDSYDSDRLLQLAGGAIVSRIGEVVARLDTDFLAAHPGVPFRSAKAMRNLVAREYHRTDPALVWGVLASRIPNLVRQVCDILDETRADPAQYCRRHVIIGGDTAFDILR